MYIDTRFPVSLCTSGALVAPEYIIGTLDKLKHAPQPQAKDALSVTSLAPVREVSLSVGGESRGHHGAGVRLEGEDLLAAVDQKSTHGH